MSETSKTQQNVSLLGLVALTVTTVIGAGVFNLPRDLASLAAPGPSLTALVIASIAFAVFVYCLKYLQDHYPHFRRRYFLVSQNRDLVSLFGFLSCTGLFGYLIVVW